MKNYLNVAFYRFFDFKDFQTHRSNLRMRCHALGIKGTILLSPEGINGFLAGSAEAIHQVHRELNSIPGLENLWFKESWSEQIPFQRIRVKLKKEIIPMGRPEVRPHEVTGRRVDPSDLKTWLDQGKEVALLDTRNDYEIEHGTFRGAMILGMRTFREFAAKLEAVAPDLKQKPVVMFCTGGIRCEKATALAMSMGFKDVYQLEGGILNYFEKCGAEHYQGDCFVFDERVALTDSLAAHEEIRENAMGDA